MQQAGYVEEWDDWGEAPAASPRAISAPSTLVHTAVHDLPQPQFDNLIPKPSVSSTVREDFRAPQIEDSCEYDPCAAIIPFPLNGKAGQFPAFMARSGLFSVGFADTTGSPLACEPIDIPAQGKYSITLHGSRLTMRNKRLWEVAIDFAKSSKQGVGGIFQIPILDFCKALGWNDRSSKARDWVWNELSRLAEARIDFQLPDGTQGMGTLISTIARKDGIVSLRLNPDFVLTAFGRDTQFSMNPARRTQLKSTLAQWLHDFFCTHTTAPPLTFGYLRQLSGYAGQERRFPADLVKAMSEIKAAAPELVSGFEVQKVGKNGAHWRLCVSKGTELPSYTLPSHGGSNASRGDARSAKRRGLQL